MEPKLANLHWPVVPEAAISGAVSLQSDEDAFLTFNAVDRRTNEPAGTAVVTFAGCMIAKFGYPNDEAAAAIPRYKRFGYDAYEMLNSPWHDDLSEMNQFAFPGTQFLDRIRDYRHFVVLFHDSTYECLARSVTVEVSREPYAKILGRLAVIIASK